MYNTERERERVYFHFNSFCTTFNYYMLYFYPSITIYKCIGIMSPFQCVIKFYGPNVPFLWDMKHQHHLMWPWCTAVTADTARPVLQASVTLCCCMYDTSERLFSIHIILAYGNVLEGWSPLEFKRSAVRKRILYPTKILVIFIHVTDGLSTVSTYFIIFHVFLILEASCDYVKFRIQKSNLICIYLFGRLKCIDALIFALDLVVVKQWHCSYEKGIKNRCN